MIIKVKYQEQQYQDLKKASKELEKAVDYLTAYYSNDLHYDEYMTHLKVLQDPLIKELKAEVNDILDHLTVQELEVTGHIPAVNFESDLKKFEALESKIRSLESDIKNIKGYIF